MLNTNRANTELSADLESIGIRAGDCLIVHCTFKSLKDSGATPKNVIDGLLNALGSNGTLMMPTFTYSYSGIYNVIPFNPRTTPGYANGILSETFRCRHGILRSAHPTYSIAVIGKHAEFLTSQRELCSPLGRGSSFEDALMLNTKILLLGIGNNRNSMIHHVEVAAGLPYNDIPFREFWKNTALVEKNGQIEAVALVPEYPACSDNFSWLDRQLLQEGIACRESICGADSLLINSAEMKKYLLKEIKKKADCLLCNSIICEPCTLRRRRLKEQGLM